MAARFRMDDPPRRNINLSMRGCRKRSLLGRGSYGTVWKVLVGELSFAVKEVSLSDPRTKQLEQEISVLSKIEHENIVQYCGTDKDESKLYIFLELVTEGSLYNLYSELRDSGGSLLDSELVSIYTRQILQGLKYLHGNNVIHRDIKCANILVDKNGSVKLADFGLAKVTGGNSNHSSCGSPYWMAPEVVKTTDQGYGLAADIWSLGCTVLELATMVVPYYPVEPYTALSRIFREIPPEIPASLPRHLRDFIQRCLQVNPRDRPTAVDLLDHPFVREEYARMTNPPVQEVNDARSRRFTL